MKLKAPISFFMGVAVTALCTVQFFLSGSSIRLLGVLIGLYLIVLGWKIGWTTHRLLVSSHRLKPKFHCD